MTNFIKSKDEELGLVHIEVRPVILEGNLCMPERAEGIILFAHGSGSSRHSPRNHAVAQDLNKRNFATLLIDLLTLDEESIDVETQHLRFDISLLSKRIITITDWVTENPDTRPFQIGYFGASTGAGAALVAATERPSVVRAIVSRGGRPDLAGSALAHVVAPTLFIVGENDISVIELNRTAMAQLFCKNSLEIVSGASHLFEESGALDKVASLALEWFERHLAGR